MNIKNMIATTWGLVCAIGLAAMALRADEPVLKEGWRQLIVSSQEADRGRAKALVLQQHRGTVSSLREVLSMGVVPNEPFYSSATPRNMAISLLGELRAAEAVPALAGWLRPRPGQNMIMLELTDLSPAGSALVKVGQPAVPALLDILASVGVSSEWKRTAVTEPDRVHVRFVGPPRERYSPLGDQCLRILVRIKGLEETEAGLKRYIAAETDDARKKNLEDALSALSRPSLREGFQNIQAQKEAIERNEWAGWWKRQQEEQARQKAWGPQPEATQEAGR